MSNYRPIKTPTTRTRRMTDDEFAEALTLKCLNLSLPEILQTLLDLSEKPPQPDESTERSKPGPQRSQLTLVKKTK
jgi:hypothetical protein